MKKVLVFLVLLFPLRSVGQAITPNLSLNLPAHGATNWDTQVNQNWAIIDNAIANLQGTFTGAAKFPVNVQTVSYAVTVTDFQASKLIVMNSSSATNLTLLATAPPAGQTIVVRNINTGIVTIQNNGRSIDQVVSTSALAPGQSVGITSDGGNYYTMRGSPQTLLNPVITSPQITGTITNYNGAACLGNCFGQMVAHADLTGQTANVGSTTLFSVPSTGAGFYCATAYLVVTTAGTTSTLPVLNVQWTDVDTSVSGNEFVGSTSTGNTVGTTNTANASAGAMMGCFNAKASTTITYTTTGYASTGTAMQFALHAKLFYIGN